MRFLPIHLCSNRLSQNFFILRVESRAIIAITTPIDPRENVWYEHLNSVRLRVMKLSEIMTMVLQQIIIAFVHMYNLLLDPIILILTYKNIQLHMSIRLYLREVRRLSRAIESLCGKLKMCFFFFFYFFSKFLSFMLYPMFVHQFIQLSINIFTLLFAKKNFLNLFL